MVLLVASWLTPGGQPVKGGVSEAYQVIYDVRPLRFTVRSTDSFVVFHRFYVGYELYQKVYTFGPGEYDILLIPDPEGAEHLPTRGLPRPKSVVHVKSETGILFLGEIR